MSEDESVENGGPGGMNAGPTTGVEFDDDFVEVVQIGDDVDEVLADNDIERQPPPVVPAEVRDLAAGRVTRSGRVYDRPAQPQVGALNPRLQAEMRRIGTTWYNPIPETILNNGQPNAPLGREVEENQVVQNDDAVGDGGLFAMDHLFDDFAFYMRETTMAAVETTKSNDSDNLQNKLRQMHILDALDYLRNDDNNIPMKQRDECLREVVLLLKSELPKSYKEAWDHPDPKMRARWRNAFKKETGSMGTRKVWKVIKKSKMPKGRRCVKSKWVFDIKRDGTFKVRLVACGYTQIPG